MNGMTPEERADYIAFRREEALARLTPRQRLARWWSWWGWQTVVAVLIFAALFGIVYWITR
jgi:hypothetical protein